MEIRKVFLPTGETRAIWTAPVSSTFRQHHVLPKRASRIEVIQEGKSRGLFHVDFSLLADATGNDDFRCCLLTPFASYEEANRAELDWLRKNWLAS